MSEDSATSDPRAAARKVRAERYFEEDLARQRNWYSNRASTCKERSQLLGLFIIAAGAGTTFVQVLPIPDWIPILSAALGATIALAEGWQRIARYGDTWMAYRMASEKMKRESRLYVNGAGAYREEVNEDDAFVRFVEAIETIIAEEQQIYWQAHGNESPASRGAAAESVPGTAEGGTPG